MPNFDHLQAKCVAGDIANPTATTASSTQQLIGPITYNAITASYGSNVDEIDLGQGAGYAGSPGAGVHRPLWLHLYVSAVTGSNGVTVNVTSANNATHTSVIQRYSSPVITATGFYCFPIGAIPDRYAYLETVSGSTSTATLVAALSDAGNTMFMTQNPS